MLVRRSDIILKPDKKRVILKPFEISDKNRIKNIVRRILALKDPEMKRQLDIIKSDFAHRHPDLLSFFRSRFEQIRACLEPAPYYSDTQILLIGAYFSHEYAIEAAALFNPSIVWHPDQSGLQSGSRRFILSLRATGEGHISSLTFRSGTIDSQNNLELDDASPFATIPLVVKKENLNDLSDQTNKNNVQEYDINFDSKRILSERVIFPVTASESNGIEDARFVQFMDKNESNYFATYTAYNGKSITPRLFETKDFLHFRSHALEGPAIFNKGLALFPQKIKRKYAMLSRQDNENNLIMFSENLYSWSEMDIVQSPVFPWEFIQLGNCGSPIKTEAGWLILSHGVGAMRRYSIGAFLLDLADPRKLIGRTKEPLISPNEDEREGYVPNVVYSCGGILHGDQLILPYAMSDSACSFATISLTNLLKEMIN